MGIFSLLDLLEIDGPEIARKIIRHYKSYHLISHKNTWRMPRELKEGIFNGEPRVRPEDPVGTEKVRTWAPAGLVSMVSPIPATPYLPSPSLSLSLQMSPSFQGFTESKIWRGRRSRRARLALFELWFLPGSVCSPRCATGGTAGGRRRSGGWSFGRRRGRRRCPEEGGGASRRRGLRWRRSRKRRSAPGRRRRRRSSCI